jgi:hypothetical protein
MPIVFLTRLAASGRGFVLGRPAFVLLAALHMLTASWVAMPAGAAENAAAAPNPATRVVFSLPPGLKYELLALKNPERLVVDFPLRRIPPAIKAMTDQFDRNDSLIKAMRYGQFKPGVVRVVFDLKQEVDVSAEQSPGSEAGKSVQQLALRLQGKALTPLVGAMANAAATTVTPDAATAAPTPTPIATPAPAVTPAANPAASAPTATTIAAQPAPGAGGDSERIQRYTPMPRARNAAVATVQPQPARPLSLGTETGIDIGIENGSYRWQDWTAGSDYARARGRRTGASIALTQAFDTGEDDVFVRAEVSYVQGRVTRTVRNGDVISTGTRQVESAWDSRALIGSDWHFADFTLSPFIGVGYRAMQGKASIDGTAYYLREIKQTYLPLGLTLRQHLTNGARLSTTAEYDHLLGSSIRSHYGDDTRYTTLIGTVDNKAKKGFGARLSVNYEQPPWSIGPFFRYWKVGESDKVYLPVLSAAAGSANYANEGVNKSYEFGVSAKYRF